MMTMLLALSLLTACETNQPKPKPAPPLPPDMQGVSALPWNRPTKQSEMGGVPFGMPQSN
jgi:hypothetical protein